MSLRFGENEQKGDFENPKVLNCDFSTKSVPNQCGFFNGGVPWD